MTMPTQSLPTLALFTSSFPFGKKETFLETEIPFLAARFQVEIVPVWTTGDDLARRRKLPEGVIVRHDLAQRFHYSLSTNYRNIWFSFTHMKDFWQLLKSEFRKMPRKGWAAMRVLYNAAQGLALANTIQTDPSLSTADVLYSYWLTTSALSIALAKEAGHTGVAISRVHRFELYVDVANGRYQPFQGNMIHALDHIASISDDGRDYLQRLYPAQQTKISTCRLGVKGTKQNIMPSAAKCLRLVSCSRLVALKQIHLLIQALHQCRIPICWTHLGGGPLEKDLRQQAASLPAHITWKITGNIRNTQVLQFYATQPIDLFINISQIEGVPVSVMEAMGHGIPVYATNVGATGELVNGENGRLLSPQITAQELASELEQFFTLSNEQKLSMRQFAWNTWNAKSNAANQYSQFANWLLALSQGNQRS